MDDITLQPQYIQRFNTWATPVCVGGGRDSSQQNHCIWARRLSDAHLEPAVPQRHLDTAGAEAQAPQFSTVLHNPFNNNTLPQHLKPPNRNCLCAAAMASSRWLTPEMKIAVTEGSFTTQRYVLYLALCRNNVYARWCPAEGEVVCVYHTSQLRGKCV